MILLEGHRVETPDGDVQVFLLAEDGSRCVEILIGNTLHRLPPSECPWRDLGGALAFLVARGITPLRVACDGHPAQSDLFYDLERELERTRRDALDAARNRDRLVRALLARTPGIVYLDMDGVMNGQRWFDLRATLPPDHPLRQGPQGTLGIDPACVAELNALVERTGAAVVIVSRWRNGDTTYIAEALAHRGFRGLVLDEAPRASSPAHRGLDRYGHILTWRDATGFSGPWVVLDDEDYGYPRDRFVLTDPATGLTPEAVERAVSILRTPVSP